MAKPSLGDSLKLNVQSAVYLHLEMTSLPSSSICQLNFNWPAIGSIFNPWRWIRVDLDSQYEHGTCLLNRNVFVFHHRACGLLVPFNIRTQYVLDETVENRASLRARARDPPKLRNDKIWVSVGAAKMVKQLWRSRHRHTTTRDNLTKMDRKTSGIVDHYGWRVSRQNSFVSSRIPLFSVLHLHPRLFARLHLVLLPIPQSIESKSVIKASLTEWGLKELVISVTTQSGQSLEIA